MTSKKKWYFRKRIILPLILLLVCLLGPRLKFDKLDSTMPNVNLELNELDKFIDDKESKIEGLRVDNEAKIVWADSVRKTEYAVVYLHGYSASPMEGDGVHFPFVERYGCNLYLARLQGHGTDGEENFLDSTPQKWLDSAKEAIAIGKLIGEKVIIMSASTGSTLSTYLAAEHPELIHAQIMYSPNFKLANGSAQIFKYPWGLQIARLISGGKYREGKFQKSDYKYWTKKQRLEGVAALANLVGQVGKPEIYEKITQPYFLAYYYKNEKEQDTAVSVEEMKVFNETTKTSDNNKIFQAFPDVGDHCMTHTKRCKDLENLQEQTFKFAEEILLMKPIE